MPEPNSQEQLSSSVKRH